MWLDQHLNWSTHYGKLLTKLKRNLNLLKHGQRLLTRECKKLIYFAHIQSHINYGLLPWGNSITDAQLTKLTNIQKRCLQYIDKSEDFKSNRILKVPCLLFLENCKFGYKLINKQLPRKIEESCMFDNNRNSLEKSHRYNTRNKRIPNVPIKMNKIYRASFLNKGPQSLLSVSTTIKDAPNLKLFSVKLKK